MSKFVVAAAIVAFLAAVGWAFSTGQALNFDAFSADPWVVVMGADLYLGFLLFSVIIVWNENSLIRALAWIVPLVIIGNLASAIYLLLNATKIIERLQAARSAE